MIYCFALYITSLVGTSSHASNFHEHYSTLASYDDYVHAFHSIGKNLDDIPLNELAEEPRDAIESIFGKGLFHRLLFQAELKDIPKLSFNSLANKIKQSHGNEDVTVDEIKRAFFEFNDFNSHDEDALEAIGWNVRTQTMKTLDQKSNGAGIVDLFRTWVKRVPLAERTQLDISIRKHLFEKDHLHTLVKIRKLLAQEGTMVNFFFPVERKALFDDYSKEKYTKLLKKLNKAEALGQLSGVDLTGSLHEARWAQIRQTSKKQESHIKQRLIQLFEFVHDSSPQLEMRIHSWEAPANPVLDASMPRPQESSFYDALKTALLDPKNKKILPKTIRIGHVAGIIDEDIAFFKKANEKTGVHFAFEANVEANKISQRVTDQHMVNIIEKLDTAGFPVFLGTDGEGIYGGTIVRMKNTLKTLKAAGLSDGALRRLKERALEDYPKELFQQNKNCLRGLLRITSQ